jgi:hypothetical protein
MAVILSKRHAKAIKSMREALKARYLIALSGPDPVCDYAAVPAMIEALWPPKPKLLLITVRSLRSRGAFGV